MHNKSSMIRANLLTELDKNITVSTTKNTYKNNKNKYVSDIQNNCH